jgi:hypothetical protein
MTADKKRSARYARPTREQLIILWVLVTIGVFSIWATPLTKLAE